MWQLNRSLFRSLNRLLFRCYNYRRFFNSSNNNFFNSWNVFSPNIQIRFEGFLSFTWRQLKNISTKSSLYITCWWSLKSLKSFFASVMIIVAIRKSCYIHAIHSYFISDAHFIRLEFIVGFPIWSWYVEDFFYVVRNADHFLIVEPPNNLFQCCWAKTMILPDFRSKVNNWIFRQVFWCCSYKMWTTNIIESSN